MAERLNRSMGFVDAMVDELGGPRASEMLMRLERSLPWRQIVRPILRLPEYQPKPRGGRPAWSPVVMVKCLLLAKWFNLSDPALEDALQDRISFRRFVGLSFADATPDETTFVRFRDRLREANLHETLFKDVVKHIAKQGLLVKEGTMVDATVIEQSTGRPRRDGTSTRDQEASFTKKYGRTYHGYKAHVGADRSGIITKCRLSTAKDHDSRHIDALIRDERVAVYADSAYDERARRKRLRRRGVIDGIIYQRRRNQKVLDPAQVRWNKRMSRLRAPIERLIAHLKHHLHYRRVRYRTLARNDFDLHLIVTAHNLKRSVRLADAW